MNSIGLRTFETVDMLVSFVNRPEHKWTEKTLAKRSRAIEHGTRIASEDPDEVSWFQREG